MKKIRIISFNSLLQIKIKKEVLIFEKNKLTIHLINNLFEKYNFN